MNILLSTAVIIILAKVFSHLASKVKMPPVLGMLALGLIIGPSGLRLLNTNSLLTVFSEIGVVILLFMAGLETDLGTMRREGRPAILTAVGGVILPFAAGFFLSTAFGFSLAEGLVFGTILTATSVSVPVMTLFDLKRLRGVEGRTILGAAIVDDVLAVLVLTVVLGMVAGGVGIFSALGKISLYFLVASGIGILFFERLVQLAMKLQANQALLGVALGILLIYSGSAHSAGITSLTGAYLAGLFLGRTSVRRRLLSGMDTVGHTLFISIFFVNVGLQAELVAVGRMYPFFVLYILVAIVSKFLGSGLGALCGHLEFRRSIRVGVGMVPRGEVALAVTSVAVSRGLMGGPEFSSTVLLVLVTALITPPLLKWSFASGIRLKQTREGNDVSSRNYAE